VTAAKRQGARLPLQAMGEGTLGCRRGRGCVEQQRRAGGETGWAGRSAASRGRRLAELRLRAGAEDGREPSKQDHRVGL